MKRWLGLSLLFLVSACGAHQTPRPLQSIHSVTVVDIDGHPQPLSQYAGKVLLVVNVASRCGFTPQYTGLEQLWNDYRDRGVVVLGFPSNEFMGQEPGSEPEIKKFCSLKYNVTFPMFGKVHTHGSDVSPLYRILGESGRPRWNFYKYVVGKDGKVREVFSSFVKPDAPKLRNALDAALAATVQGASP